MNVNVDYLWQQALLYPQQVLKLLPLTLNNPILKLLRRFAIRVRLLQNKGQVSLENSIVLQGSILETVLQLQYFAGLCNQKKGETSEKQSEMISALMYLQKISKSGKLANLIDHVLNPKDLKLELLRTSPLSHLIFIDLIIPELIPLISPAQLVLHQIDTYLSQQISFELSSIDAEQLLNMLSFTVPSILHQFRLQSHQLPFSLRNQPMQLLYIDRALQWVVKKTKKLAFFNRSVITALLKYQKLNLQQQSLLMQTVFRYFYIYHQQRFMKAVEILFEAYNKLEEPSRFALSASFALFLTRAKKLGKSKMVQAMASKSKWIEEMQAKSLVEDQEAQTQQDQRYGQSIVLKPGEKTNRYLEVIQPYSVAILSISAGETDFELHISQIYDWSGKQVEEIVIKEQRLKSLNKRIIFKAAGLYQIGISNTFSWISFKKITYRVTLFSPLQLKHLQLQNWKSCFLSLGSYEGLACGEVREFRDEPITAIINMSKKEYFCYEIKPTKQSNKTPQIYETDNEARFLQRIRFLFDIQKPLMFIWQEQGSQDSEVSSLEQVVEVLQSRDGKKKEKSVVIEIPIKKGLL